MLVRRLAFGSIRTSLLFEAEAAAEAASQHDAMEALQLPSVVASVATQPAMAALALRYRTMSSHCRSACW